MTRILVAPDYHNEYGGSWYTNSSVTGRWEDFVAEDLIRHIDVKYRTIPKRGSRGIAGHSLGGHGAIKLAMKHPELVCALYAMSPAWIVFSETIKDPYAQHLREAVLANDKDAFPNLHWRARAFIALAVAIHSESRSRAIFWRVSGRRQGKSYRLCMRRLGRATGDAAIVQLLVIAAR